MPRIYSRASDPYDYCLECFPKTEAAARRIHGNDGDGPDGRGDCFGYDADHPPYEDDCDYRCTKCRKVLKGIDDYARWPYGVAAIELNYGPGGEARFAGFVWEAVSER